MVVFAVLAAFSVEAWREERQLRRFADMARAAVELEVETNLEEFRATRTSLRALLERIARVQREAASGVDTAPGGRGLDLSFALPEISSAAWRTAQASQAAAIFDYNWVIRVSRAYEILDSYGRAREQCLDALSPILDRLDAHPLDIKDELHRLNGRVLLLDQLHEAAQEQMEALLVDTD